MISDRVALAVFRTGLLVSGEPVIFVRGETRIECKAVRGSTNWDTNAAYPGNRVGTRSTDWLIVAVDLTPDDADSPLVPERSDEIHTGNGDFRVMPFGPDSQLWKYHDRGRQIYRIFSKERS